MSVFARNTVPETQTPSQDPVFRAMSALAKQGFGHEDLYVRLTAAGMIVTRAECRRFMFLKSRRAPAQGVRGPICRLNGATPDAER